MEKLSVGELKRQANEIRKDIVRMIAEAGSGHPGGSLSSAEIITALYFNVLNHRSSDPNWVDRDRFVLSKGHACPAVYAAMARAGYFPVEELLTLRRIGSRLQGHPDVVRLPGVEASTGSLGQGLSVAVGMALGAKIDGKKNRVFCLLGDGELNEGQIWEAAATAAHYGLDNLCGIVDDNGMQIDGRMHDVKNMNSLADKWVAFGWRVVEIDGHNMAEVLSALKTVCGDGIPTVIIARTVKGKGVSFMENEVEWHGRAPTREGRDLALAELEKLDKDILNSGGFVED